MRAVSLPRRSDFRKSEMRFHRISLCCGRMIRIKRVYDQASKEDGFRILVDRLWPRGLSKGKAKVDLWLKEVAPSDDLRKWFSHDPMKWQGFAKQYENELKGKQELLREIKQAEKEKGTVTILYSARDEEHNQAVALVAFLQKT
jgi:uncharacterized protein YeaO (DUF488 family)